MLERVTESGLIVPEPFLEAFDDELEVPEAFLRAFPAVTVTGPRLELVGDPFLDTVVMRWTWDVENRGDAQGVAGLRVNLQIDAALGDFSQLILEANGDIAGTLAPAVLTRVMRTPRAVAAGATERLQWEIDIPVNNMLGRQGSVAGFNWWIVELTIRDLDKDRIATFPDGSEARYEIRDWFRVSATPAVSEMVAVGDPIAVAYVEHMFD